MVTLQNEHDYLFVLKIKIPSVHTLTIINQHLGVRGVVFVDTDDFLSNEKLWNYLKV